MFNKHMHHSNNSTSSLGADSSGTPKAPGSPTMLHRYTSNETLPALSRSITATSINSTSTVNTTFETNWMPNSFVVGKKKYKISLRLRTHEIELLRKSWAIVTSTETQAVEVNHFGSATSRTNSSPGLNLTSTYSNNSTSANSVAGTTAVMSTNQSFNAAAFSSFLFCIQFYNNFIGMDPEIERLIPSIRHQASAFASVISVAIGTLEDLSKMKESLLNLGHLHARILGIDSPYFKIMGEALIKTFQDWFGNSPESFPLELEDAWIKLYCFLANSIIQGGIDPVIGYNIQPAKRNGVVIDSTQIDEDDEIDDDEKGDQLTNLQDSDLSSNYTSSMADDSLKKTSFSKNTSNHTLYSKYEPSINSSSQTKSSYIPNVASKNINRLKKSRGNNKEDCTIM